MDIQWFPGHMTKTKRQMEQDIKLVDLVVEVVDARIPNSSKKPYLDEIWKKKPRIIAMNKSDLADPSVTALWKAWYQEQGFGVVELNSLKGAGLNQISMTAEEVCKEKREKDRSRGMKERPIRMMITGIPNVGKSTMINQLAGRSGAAKTGNKPGVTRGRQWIKIRSNLELMDTPGMLWPKFEDPLVASRIALVGSIKDELLDMDDLAYQLIGFLKQEYKEGLCERYKLTEEEAAQEAVPLIETIGAKRGFRISGGEIDFSRTAHMLVDEFRSGKIGRVSLERPEV